MTKVLFLDIDGVEKISAYSLSFEEHRNYIVDYNEHIYFDVVNHWEG